MHQISEWNKLDLKGKTSGKTQTVCPECSESRKKKHEKCVSINISEGFAKCNHCEALFFKDNNSNNTVLKHNYSLPIQEFQNYTRLSESLVKWFKNRGISQNTLIENNITEEIAFFPSVGKELNSVCFNYFEGALLVDKKFRSGKKDFSGAKNAKKIFFNINNIIGQSEVYITEGECFKGDTEVLTKNGWIKLKDFTDKNTEVLQVDLQKKYSFVKPKNIIKKIYNGDLIEFKNSKNYEITTTLNHNIVVEYKNGELKKEKATDLVGFLGSGKHIPRACSGTNKVDFNIEDDLIRMQVMLSADFTFRDSGDFYGCFKKERKTKRATELLDRLNIRHSNKKDSRNYDSMYIHRGQFESGFFTKLFNFEWLYSFSERQLRIILDEILFWDGNSVPNRNQIEFSSKEYHNATFVQTLSHLLGYMSTIIPRSNKFGSWFKVSVLFGKQKTSLQASTKRSYEKHNDFVYCVTVDTGMLLVRQNDQISICGNCDVLSLYEIGIKNAISLPNGANDNDTVWINCEKYLKDVKKFYIATDNDEPGNLIAEKIAQRLGRYRCERVLFEGKDANEDLVNGVLKDSILNTYKYPVAGTYDVNDLWQSMLDTINEGPPLVLFPKAEWAIDLNKIFGVMEKQLTVVTGMPSHGKSYWTDWYLLNLSNDYNKKISWFSPEHGDNEDFMIELSNKAIGQNFYKCNNELRYEFKEWANERIYLTSATLGHTPTWDWIFETFKEQLFRYGVDVFVIDAFNKLELPKGENRHAINNVLMRLSSFCIQYNVNVFLVAHPTKMQKQDNGLYRVPDLYDVAGSADFRNQTHNGYSIYRYFEEGQERTEFYNLKVKNTKYQGKISGTTEFNFNEKNGRFYRYGGVEDNEPLWNKRIEVKPDPIIENIPLDKLNDVFDPTPNYIDELPF